MIMRGLPVHKKIISGKADASDTWFYADPEPTFYFHDGPDPAAREREGVNMYSILYGT